MNKELLTKLRHKKEHQRWKQEQVTQEEYSNTVQAHRDSIRMAKAHLDSYLVRNVRGKKGYHKYISTKRKTRENVELLLNGAGNVLIKETEKAKALNAYFASIFTSKTTVLQKSQVSESTGQV